MFQHLLVPLDGSPMAETALHRAVELAQLSRGDVTVLHLIERRPPDQVHGERHLRDSAEADRYMAGIRARFADRPGFKWHVHELAVDDVVAGIVAHIAELGVDTIVMSQHGRGGLRAWRLGRLPQQVAARGAIPLLLVKTQSGQSSIRTGSAFRRVLIPHDDVPAHAPAVDVGAELARLCGAAVHLLRVVPTRGGLTGPASVTGGMLPSATRSLLEIDERWAEDDLMRHAGDLKAAGVPVTIDVVRGDPVRKIVACAREQDSDVIVLGTHALAGTRAFWEGSAGTKICARVPASVLLVPVSG